jgi:hypothetical protein
LARGDTFAVLDGVEGRLLGRVRAAKEESAPATVVSTGTEGEVAVCSDGSKVGGAERVRAERARAVGLPLLLGDCLSEDALLRGKQVGTGVTESGW